MSGLLRRIAEAAAIASGAVPLFALVLVTVGTVLAATHAALDNRPIRAELPETAARLGSGADEDTLLATLSSELAGIVDLTVRRRVLRRLRQELAELSSGQAPRRSCLAELDCTRFDALEVSERRLLLTALERALEPWTLRHLARVFDFDLGLRGWTSVPDDRRIYRTVLVRTVVGAGAVAILCTVLGTVFGLALVRTRSRPFLMGALFVALATPHIVATIAWLDLTRWLDRLAQAGWPLGPLGEPRLRLVAAMIGMLLPLVALPVAASASSVPPELHEMAALDGAGAWSRFWWIDGPLLRPAALGGGLLTFTTALGFFVAPELLARPEDRPLASFIAFFTSEVTNPGMLGALTLVLLLLVVPPALWAERSHPPSLEGVAADDGRSRHAAPPATLTVIAVIVGVGVVFPLAAMLGRAVGDPWARSALVSLLGDPRAFRALATTATVGLTVAVLVTGAGLAAISAAVLRPRLLSHLLPLVALYVALPDVAVAVAWLRWRALLELSDTAVLILALAVHMLPVTLVLLASRLALLDRAVLDNARVDGAYGLALVVHILVPMLWPAILAGLVAAMLAVATTSVLPIFLAGPRIPLTGWYLWSSLRDAFDSARAAAVLVFLLGLLATAAAAVHKRVLLYR